MDVTRNGRFSVSSVWRKPALLTWFGLNLLDVSLSILALQYGAGRETGPLVWFLDRTPKTWYYDPSSYITYGAIKMGGTVLVPLLLSRIHKLHLMKWLNIGIAVVCAYLAFMLVLTFRG